jgi:penicillin V acylase-like amidase (Ntn superfamily)
LKWKAKYGVVAIDALEKDMIADGLNEEEPFETIVTSHLDQIDAISPTP